MPRAKSKAKPQLLKWARENSRLNPEQAAEKVGVAVDALLSWEAGTDAPTLPQLRKAAEAYRRPLFFFYLPKPPQGIDPLRDYRRKASATDESFELAGEIRWAHEMREVALEALRVIGDPPDEFELEAELDEDPVQVAKRIVEALEITPEHRRAWKDGYEAYRAWRTAIEEHGVLCFQFSSVEVSEARGFSIGEDLFPIIAVNASDAVVARIFTLIHEVTHVMLGSAGKCDLHEGTGSKDKDRIEVFCNAVAGEVLVPRGMLLKEEALQGVKAPIEWEDGDLRALANAFRVSREVILRRLLQLGLATQAFYKEKREEFASAEAAADKPGGGDYYRNLRSKLGNPVIRGVLGAWQSGKLTASEAASYLRVRVEALAKLMATT